MNSYVHRNCILGVDSHFIASVQVGSSVLLAHPIVPKISASLSTDRFKVYGPVTLDMDHINTM